jgi:hypothetical protein
MSSKRLIEMGKLIKEHDDPRSVGFYREKDAWKMHDYYKSKGAKAAGLYKVNTKRGDYEKWYVAFED